MRLEHLETGIVYRNPKPYLRAVNAWHPTLVALPSGELLASFDLGQGPEGLDYRTCLARSSDNGQSWSEPVDLFSDAVQPTTNSVRIACMSDGQLTAIGARLYRSDPEEGIVNRANHGFVPIDVILLTSDDNGYTWSEPRVIEPPLVGPGFEICHSIVELVDGRWLWPTATLMGWDGELPNGLKAIAFVSHDRGQTWPDHLELFDDSDGATHWETSLRQMEDGRIATITWTLEDESGAAMPTLYRVSVDGTTFSPQQPTGFLAQTAKLLPLGGDDLLCVYRRDDQPGLWATRSELNGNSWTNHAEIPLWEGAGSGMTGADKTNELSALKFGFPSLLRVAPDQVLVAFWCCEDTIWNIRWIRIGI